MIQCASDGEATKPSVGNLKSEQNRVLQLIWLEQTTHNRQVLGSIPRGTTTGPEQVEKLLICVYRIMVITSGFQPDDLSSILSRRSSDAALAHLVEHLFCKQDVIRSSRISGSMERYPRIQCSSTTAAGYEVRYLTGLFFLLCSPSVPQLGRVSEWSMVRHQKCLVQQCTESSNLSSSSRVQLFPLTSKKYNY